MRASSPSRRFLCSGRSVATVLATLCLLPILSGGSAYAQWRSRRPPPAPASPGLWQKNAVGGQLGPWFAQDFGKDITLTGGRFNGNETGFLLEFFYQPHLTGVVNGDINVGAIGRGQLSINLYGGTDSATAIFGDVTLYPLGLGIIVAPFARNLKQRIQPTLRAGGSLLVLTQRGRTIRVNSVFFRVDVDTHVEFGYYAGAGVNWVLGHRLMLVSGARYQYAQFDEDLLAGGNYSGWQVMFGAAYLYR